MVNRRLMSFTNVDAYTDNWCHNEKTLNDLLTSGWLQCSWLAASNGVPVLFG